MFNIRSPRPLPSDETLPARFWGMVDKSQGPAACWLWQGKTQNGGYGVIWSGGAKGRTYYAHRLAWSIAHDGAEPGAMVVCHSCDNPQCVNPEHLFLGTPRDNYNDMRIKGRAAPPTARARGEGVGGSKLTEPDVREIRRKRSEGATLSALGREFGVDRTTVRDAVDGTSWAHVKAEGN